MTYLAWKLVHVISVVLFLGNITTGLFWAARAHRTHRFDQIASTFDSIIRSDRWFTVPGVIGILLSGVAAAGSANLPILGTGWILWPIILFSISGIVFGMRVAPLHRRIVRLALDTSDADAAWANYVATFRKWEFWGLVALLTPVAALVIMVLKPSLPGL